MSDIQLPPLPFAKMTVRGHGDAYLSEHMQEYARAAVELDRQQRGEAVVYWRDVANELPVEAQEVLFVRDNKAMHGAWIDGIFWHSNQKVAAAKWMPLPPINLSAPQPAEPAVNQSLTTDEPDYSEMSREQLERHAHIMAQMLGSAKQREFFEKYALGPKSAPSCICCGHVPEEVAIRHSEIPGIVVCRRCRDAALAQPTIKAGLTDEREAFDAAWKARPWHIGERTDKDRAWAWWQARASLTQRLNANVDNLTLRIAGCICRHLDVVLDQSRVMSAAREILTFALAQPTIKESLTVADLPGMWDRSDLSGGATDCEPVKGEPSDMVLVPRNLIASACSAIDKKRNAPGTLAELRRYTTGDLAHYQGAQPATNRWTPHTVDQHLKALAAGDLMAVAEEAGGNRIAENVVEVTRSDIERIILAIHPAASAEPIGLGWVVRERRGSDGELQDCFVEAPATDGMAYGLEVLGDDYTGYGDVECKLKHCRMIVSWANAAPVAAQPDESGDYKEGYACGWNEACTWHRERGYKPHIAAQPSVPDGLITALRSQRQIDEDGTEVGVSRQAVDEAAAILEALSIPTPPADGQESQS